MKHVYICEAITTIKIAYLSFPKLFLVPFWSLSPPISLRGPWNCFLFLEISLHFLGFYVSGIICCAVCVRAVVFFFYLAILRWLCVSFVFITEWQSVVWLCTAVLLYPYWQWGCLQFGAITNEAAINIEVQFFVHVLSYFLGKYLAVKYLGRTLVYVWLCNKLPNCFPKYLYCVTYLSVE